MLALIAIGATVRDAHVGGARLARQAADPPPALAGSWRSVANGDRVNRVYRDGDTLWVAAQAGGLVRWSLQAGTFRPVPAPPVAAPRTTRSTTSRPPSAAAWAATARGLARFVPDRDQWQVVTPSTSPGMPARAS
ncbi:MAG: hypothetical protein U0470_13035 [Anaerolineae bacterium]